MKKSHNTMVLSLGISITMFSTASAAISIIDGIDGGDGYINNGSFEVADADWKFISNGTTGFTQEDITAGNEVSLDGNKAANMRGGGGNDIYCATGWTIDSSQALNLSFYVTKGYGSNNGDELDYAIYFTSGDTWDGATRTNIATGSKAVTGNTTDDNFSHSDSLYVLNDIAIDGAANGRKLFIEFTAGSGMTSSSADYMRLDGVTLTAVPEPSSTALLGLGGLALILRRRK